MNNSFFKRVFSAVLGTAIIGASFLPFGNSKKPYTDNLSVYAADSLSISDMPSEYQYAADWIWQNRVEKEGSVARWNTLFDQIAANGGKLNYVFRWQSYKTLTLEQRQKFAEMVDAGINEWCKWLVGYENWPYNHIEVNVVGWAVLDKSCLLDLQPDETVWDNLISPYDAQYDTSNGYETIPDKLPSAPEELWSFNYFTDRNHQYNGQSFDEYLWCTQGWPNVGGCGGDWGQRLSDNAYLGIIDGTGFPHVYWHELGHGFGMTDFYGGEGASDGFPPGGFPGGKNSLMMAGSASEITDFDGWFLRYLWSKIKDDNGRFNFPEVPSEPETPVDNTAATSFSDTITSVGEGYISFAQNGTFLFSGDYYDGDEQKNLSHYETGDKITITFTYDKINNTILHIESLILNQNIRPENIKGDVNLDGELSIADAVLLQKWILNVPDALLPDWTIADMNKNNSIDVFDLCLLKRLLTEQ